MEIFIKIGLMKKKQGKRIKYRKGPSDRRDFERIQTKTKRRGGAKVHELSASFQIYLTQINGPDLVISAPKLARSLTLSTTTTTHSFSLSIYKYPAPHFPRNLIFINFEPN